MKRIQRVVVVACVLVVLASCTSDSDTSSSARTQTTSASTNPAMDAAITKVVQDNIAARHLRSAIVRVTIDGKEIFTRAFGESMTGVPATTDMHFRNGNVSTAYVATLLLKLVEQKKLSLDDKVSKWLPDLAHSDEVTIGQLAQMTSGYVDTVLGNEQGVPIYNDPFRQWTPEELLSYAVPKPLYYPPGTNWN